MRRWRASRRSNLGSRDESAHRKLDNLTVFIDNNKLQQTNLRAIKPVEPIGQKIRGIRMECDKCRGRTRF